MRRSPDALPCDRVRDEIEARLSGGLPVGLDAAVDAHLESCPSCRAELELASAIRGELAALPSFDAPPRLIEALHRRVRETSAPISHPIRRRAGGLHSARFGLAAAAAAVIAVAAIVLLLHRRPQPPALSAAEVARATAQARYALSLVADATATARRELEQGVLRERVAATALRGVSRAVVASVRASGLERSHPVRKPVRGGSP
jgi:predicted anti-sigma-YlaC factor YlaD